MQKSYLAEIKEQKSQAEIRISAFVQNEVQKLAKDGIYIDSVNVTLSPIRVLNKQIPIYYIVETHADIRL